MSSSPSPRFPLSSLHSSHLNALRPLSSPSPLLSTKKPLFHSQRPLHRLSHRRSHSNSRKSLVVGLRRASRSVATSIPARSITEKGTLHSTSSETEIRNESESESESETTEIKTSENEKKSKCENENEIKSGNGNEKEAKREKKEREVNGEEEELMIIVTPNIDGPMTPTPEVKRHIQHLTSNDWLNCPTPLSAPLQAVTSTLDTVKRDALTRSDPIRRQRQRRRRSTIFESNVVTRDTPEEKAALLKMLDDLDAPEAFQSSTSVLSTELKTPSMQLADSPPPSPQKTPSFAPELAAEPSLSPHSIIHEFDEGDQKSSPQLADSPPPSPQKTPSFAPELAPSFPHSIVHAFAEDELNQAEDSDGLLPCFDVPHFAVHPPSPKPRESCSQCTQLHFTLQHYQAECEMLESRLTSVSEESGKLFEEYEKKSLKLRDAFAQLHQLEEVKLRDEENYRALYLAYRQLEEKAALHYLDDNKEEQYKERYEGLLYTRQSCDMTAKVLETTLEQMERLQQDQETFNFQQQKTINEQVNKMESLRLENEMQHEKLKVLSQQERELKDSIEYLETEKQALEEVADDYIGCVSKLQYRTTELSSEISSQQALCQNLQEDNNQKEKVLRLRKLALNRCIDSLHETHDEMVRLQQCNRQQVLEMAFMSTRLAEMNHESKEWKQKAEHNESQYHDVRNQLFTCSSTLEKAQETIRSQEQALAESMILMDEVHREKDVANKIRESCERNIFELENEKVEWKLQKESLNSELTTLRLRVQNLESILS